MRRAPSSTLLALALLAPLAPLSWLHAQDEELPHGMDVGNAIVAVDRWIGPGKPPDDKPWANDLADLTDRDQSRHESAISHLVGFGRRNPKVVDDLVVLAGDRDPLLRSRVVAVLTGIGGEPVTTLMLQLSRDIDRQIRSQAILGLARCSGDPVIDRLIELLADQDPTLRDSAARALASRQTARAIPALCDNLEDSDDLAKRSKLTALHQIAITPEAIPVLQQQLGQRAGETRDALLEAAAASCDRRLTPVLVDIVADPNAGGRQASAWTQVQALRALATCGDRRALQVVCQVADGNSPESVRQVAAEAAKAITGYTAQAGKAWTLWWKDHQAAAPRWAEVDAELATLHDPNVNADRTTLAGFTPDELVGLVDAVLEVDSQRLATWFPARALAALRADDPARWSDVLANRVIAAPSNDPHTRAGLIVLIDDLGGPAALPALEKISQDLRTREEAERKAQDDQKVPAPDHAVEHELLGAAENKLKAKS